MGSNFNFKDFGAEPPSETGGNGRWPGNFPLSRQSSVYSLTFDEFQSTVGGIGKDFGSMNMDELLKNIYSAEENQIIGSTSGSCGVSNNGNGYLQRQGSLTLPRTLSRKTVDEVWHDIFRDYGDGNLAVGGMNFPDMQRQPTFGETTLEQFLVRAGVVREEIQLSPKTNNVSFIGNSSLPMDSSAAGFEFQHREAGLMDGQVTKSENQGFPNMRLDLREAGVVREGIQLSPKPNNVGFVFQQHDAGFMNDPVVEIRNQVSLQSSNLGLDLRESSSVTQHQSLQQLSPQPLLPNQPGSTYGATIAIPSSNKVGTMKSSDVGMVGFGGNGVTIAAASPVISSSLSPVPYVFNGSKKSGCLEKMVERRQRRMIKNRESAARSRARKQAYTVELEEEINKLKEENEALMKKQAEMMEIQKNEVLEMLSRQKENGNKRRCLRRTQTGPW